MQDLFEKIIARTVSAHIVAEDEKHICFLDIMPVAPGHLLVVPKTKVDYIFDLPDADLASLMLFAKRVAIAQRQVVPCRRIGVAVIGLEVPHTHVHLVPLNEVDDINFAKAKTRMADDALEGIALKIREAYQNLV
jgi:histidine triad (HIT) family protein